MQTTLRIDDQLYREAKAEAAREGITLTRFLESALRMKLEKTPPAAPGKPHPFRVYVPNKPLNMSNEELLRFAKEEEEKHDFAKLGIPWKKAD